MPAANCTKEIIDRVVILIREGLSIRKIAAVVGRAESTLNNWKRESSKSYNREFAEAFGAAMEEFECGKIKAGQVAQSKKHKLKKITRELQVVGPKMPPSYFTKEYIIAYADLELDLELDPNMNVKEMRAECFLRVRELREEILKVVKVEEAEVDPNQAAVKNVLTNMGRADKRWNFKEEHEHDVTDKLGKLLTEIGENRSVLPKQEEIEDYQEDQKK